MPSALLFDLDGTLVDSIELILGSARHAFIGFAGRAPTDDEWRAEIGRPLLSVIREYAQDDAEAERLLARYREYQLQHHDRLLHAYDDMLDVLNGFAAAGHPLAVVTSKADWLARRALDHVGMSALFPVLVGCDTCVNHKPHPEPVERGLALLEAQASNAIYVGDSPHDIASGRGAAVATIGVTWGAFGRAALEASGADLVIDAVRELPEAVLRMAERAGGVQTF